MNGRTCVGCRARADRSMLLRVVLRNAGPNASDTPSVAVLVPDVQCRLPGRGAWVHRTDRCLAMAVQRRAFARALRVQGRVDPSELQEWFARQLHEQAAP